jgi:predicted dehydrogenase
MRKLKVAAVGAGYFSQFRREAWSAIDAVDFVATCDRDQAKARAYAERFGVPAVYADAGAMLDRERPDLFDITTPPESHLALIRLAAARGVDTICQ